MDAFSRQHLHTDTAAAALLTYTQLSVFSRVDRSVCPYTSAVPPKMNLRVYIYCTGYISGYRRWFAPVEAQERRHICHCCFDRFNAAIILECERLFQTEGSFFFSCVCLDHFSVVVCLSSSIRFLSLCLHFDATCYVQSF